MKKLVFLALLSLIISSCNKDKHPGIIVQDYDLGICLSANLSQDEYIINSESEYQNLMNLEGCENTQLPSIDFTQYTLLGKYTSGKCRVTFDRRVLKDESSMKYLYRIYVNSKGLCKKQSVSMNWVLVPKLPSGYTVQFEVIED